MKYLLDKFSGSIDQEVNKKTRSVQKKQDEYLTQFYKDLLASYKVVQYLKESPKLFTSKITKITIPSQIPKSHLFDSKFITHTIKRYIEQHAIYDLCFNFVLYDKKYRVHFVLLNENELLELDKYEGYIDRIIMWLHMSKKYMTNECNNESFTIYFYFTPFEKKLPECSITIIGPEHVNSGVSYVCSENGEMVIFREEEWFKVFIHESFHSLGLEFSQMNQNNLNKKMKYIFPVETEVNLIVHGYPVSQRPYNPMFDVQKQLPIYSKTPKSKSLF